MPSYHFPSHPRERRATQRGLRMIYYLKQIRINCSLLTIAIITSYLPISKYEYLNKCIRKYRSALLTFKLLFNCRDH